MSSEVLSPDAVVGSGNRTRRLEMELERLTGLKSNTQVIEIGEIHCLQLFASFQGGWKDTKSTRLSSRFFFPLGVGNMLYGGAK